MEQYGGTPLPYGVWKIDNWINFTLEADENAQCELLLYKKGEEEPEFQYPMVQREGRVVFFGLKDLDTQFYEYNFLINQEVVLDPYAKKIIGREIWNDNRNKAEHSFRCGFLKEDYEWEDDSLPNHPSSQVIAYGLHVRGFSMDKSSKVKARGTFQGIIEKIPYLLEIGINQLHLLPVYEFEERSTPVNYWGYGNAFFFAPKSAYSQTGDGEEGLKDLVKALHKNGIEVVLEFPFTKEISPEYGLECLRFYAMEYHIDGFLLDEWSFPFAWIERDPILGTRKILKRQPEFTKAMRKFLKGDEGMLSQVMDWMKSNTMGRCFHQITSHNGYTLYDLVSYEEKHNEDNGENNLDGPVQNYSWNCGVEGETRKQSILYRRRNQMRNALFLVFLMQDMPFLLSGDERFHTQKGNNNAYCQDNEISWLNWKLGKRQREMLNFVKGLIQVRKKYSVLSQETPLSALDRGGMGIPEISFHGEGAWKLSVDSENRQIGVLYSGRRREEESCFVAYNMHWVSHSFALPKLPFKKKWYLVADTQSGVLEKESLLENQREVWMLERSIALFVAR